MSRPRIISLVVIAISIFFASPALAAPKAERWVRWESHEPDSGIRVDHRKWDQFLKRQIIATQDGVHRVAYGVVSDTDRKLLQEYVSEMSEIPVSKLDRREQFAYWINFYNAMTVAIVLEHYPAASIRDIDISPGLFSDGPWGRKVATIENTPLSLDDIEHRILRPIWRDPRIHYAVNCASIGCPNLAASAYRPERLEEQLNAAARSYVNSNRGVNFIGDDLIVSRIYDWFAGDFGDSESDILDHIRLFASPALRDRLSGRTEIDGYVYDWALNDYRP